jgi:hypothetical protein
MATSDNPTSIDDAIASHIATMCESGLSYDEYHQMIADLDKLAAAKERIAPARRPLSKDAILSASASIATVLAILVAEHAAPVLSKALGFVPKVFR